MPDPDHRPTICQVLLSLHMGGAEVLAAGLARALSDRYRFVFACLDGLGSIGERLRAEGFPVEVIDRKDGIDFKCGLRLSTFLRKHGVDAIHAHQFTPFFQSLIARLAYPAPSVVFTEHGRQYPDTRSAKRVAFNRILSRNNDRIVAVGEAVRQALIANEGFAPARVEVIRNGVDIASFAAVRSDVALRRSVRHEFALRHDEYAIVQVARLNPLKDHATAIRSLANLRRRGVPARLILVGDGQERAQLEAAAWEAGCERHVSFPGERTDVARILSAADAFLLSSISEGIPLTLIEAMAAGVPVVATQVGGVDEVIVDGESGLLVAAQDDKQLARQLQRLHGDSDLRRQLVLTGFERAKSLFSLQRMHAEYSQLYEQLTGSGNAGVKSGQAVVNHEELLSVGV